MVPRKKFVVFSQPRSGSSLLVDLLNSHSKIHCEREIINPGAGYFPKKAIPLARRWPAPFFGFQSLRSTKPVWGAKLLGYQVASISSAIQSLHQKDYAIVHLIRRDVLRSAISDVLAHKTGVWHRREGKQIPLNSVTLNPEPLARHLEKRAQWAEQEATAMQRVVSYKVVYEESLKQEDRLQERLGGLLEHLDVQVEPLSTSLMPTRANSLYDSVENLEDILDFISRSKWAHLLEDFNPEPPPSAMMVRR